MLKHIKGEAKKETAFPKFRTRDSLDDMGNWPVEKWRQWLPERAQMYFARPEGFRNQSLFSPFLISLGLKPPLFSPFFISSGAEPLAVQMHRQLRQSAPKAIPHVAAVAREEAVNWGPDDGVDAGRFYVDMAGLCDAPQLAEMVRAIDQKFPKQIPGPQLEPIFASVSDYVLEKMKPTEILYLVEGMRTRRGTHAPEAFMARAEHRARKGLRLPMPERLMRWER